MNTLRTPTQKPAPEAPFLEDFDVPAWVGLVPPRLRGQLEQVIQATLRTGNGDEGVVGRLRDLHLSETDRARLTLAWRLWRGWGSAIEVQQLWGVDRDLLVEILAAVARAARPDEAASILRDAAARAQSQQEAAEESVSQIPFRRLDSSSRQGASELRAGAALRARVR